MEIVIGTYEGLLLGYKVSRGDISKELISKASFIDKSHASCIKALDISNENILASAGLDEVINLVDLNLRITIGALVKHEAEISCLKFFDDKYLYACGKDGNISVWSVKNWNCETVLEGHEGPASSISLHHSGKLMLSIGQHDRKLITWNLAHAKIAFVTKINKSYEKVVWSPKGSFYLLFSSHFMQLYRLENAKMEMSIKFGQKATCACFLNDNILIVAVDKGVLKLYNLLEKSVHTKFNTNQLRIKEIIVTDDIIPEPGAVTNFKQSPLENQHKLILTGSSEGTVNIYTIDILTLSIEPVLSISTSCRITCMAISKLTSAPTSSPKPNLPTSSIKRPNHKQVSESLLDDDENMKGKKKKIPKKLKLL